MRISAGKRGSEVDPRRDRPVDQQVDPGREATARAGQEDGRGGHVSGVAMRPVGLRLSMASKNCGFCAFALPHTPPSKKTVPGETTLARIFLAAFSRARPLARWISAAFIAP